MHSSLVHNASYESHTHCSFSLIFTSDSHALNATGDKKLGEPRVQTYLWSGSNAHSRTVPLGKTGAGLGLTRSKVAEWQSEADPTGHFRTTSRGAAMQAALPAAISPSKTQTIKPAAEGGQTAQIGRKPVGECVDECQKNYRRIGLRDTYCTFLTSPKH